MSNMILANEYHVIWEALSHYQSHLENKALSAMSDKDKRKYDERLQDIFDTKKTIQHSARDTYGFELK